nr:MAG TPA: hypothetical protein [Bacteriophage sp.]
MKKGKHSTDLIKIKKATHSNYNIQVRYMEYS